MVIRYPGGECKFGVALLDGDCLKTFTVSSVDKAMKWAGDVCGSRLALTPVTLPHLIGAEGKSHDSLSANVN